MQPPADNPATAPAHEPHTSFHNMLAGLVVLVVAVTAVHWPVLHASASAFDDKQYLFDNTAVQSPGAQSIWKFLSEVSHPSTVMGYYQPFTMITLMLDCALGGRADYLLPFHRTNLILHVLNSGLIAWLVYRLFGRPWAATATALLFGLHPLTVEPIAWIGERKTVLAAFFALSSLVLYVAYVRTPQTSAWSARVRLGASVVCYFCALMSKPISVPLVAVLILLDAWPLQRLSARNMIEKIPFALLAVIFAVITVVSQARSAGVASPTDRTVLSIVYSVTHGTVFYLYKILWPFELSPHYPIPDPLSPANGVVLAGLLGSAALLAILVLSLRRTRALAVGWSVFFIMALPTLGVIGFTGVLTSDKYAYLPAVGLLLIVAWWLAAEEDRTRGRLRPAILLLLTGLVIGEATLSRRQLRYWQDSLTLAQHMVEAAPKAATVHNLLGTALSDAGQIEPALAAYQRAIELDSNYPEAHFNAGNQLLKLNRQHEAVEAYERSIRLDPGYPPARINLAAVLEKAGHLSEALEQYKSAIDLNPAVARYHYLFARCLVSAGRPQQAVEAYRECLRLLPASADRATVYNNLGYALVGSGQVQEAIAYYHKALELKPNEPMCALNLADAYAQSGQPEKALEYYEMVLRMRPDDPDAARGRGETLRRLGRSD